MIKVVGNLDLEKLTDEEKSLIVDVSHHSEIWTKQLSPPHMGPVSLHSTFVAKTVENGFQYTKVFPEHVGAMGLPTENYLKWAQKGWGMKKFDESLRHREPLYHYWYGSKLNKFEARERILVPLYIQVAKRENSFLERLRRIYYKNDKNIVLYDVDGYDKGHMSYKDILNNDREFSHAFILEMLLENGI